MILISGVRWAGGDVAAESALRAAVNNALGDQAEQAELRVSAGPPGRVIVEAASQAHAGMIVLAARVGSSMLPGKVGQYVLRKAQCPVVIVPARA